MTVLLGIDIGGTAVKLGLVAGEGNVLARAEQPFDRDGSLQEIAGRIAEAGMALSGARGVTGIGISAPGHADPATGVLVDGTHNVPGLRGESLPALLHARTGLPTFIDNDGTCAARAELLFGAGRPFSRFVVITIGTGIGGGVVIDRQPVTGPGGLPPEIGALCLTPDGPINYSGIPGTFERLASAAAFSERYHGAGGTGAATSAEEVFRLAGQGDRAAERAVDATARTIAQAFGIMVNLLNLEACIIGGGVSAAGQPLLDAVRRHLADFTWPALHRNVRVLLAEHGNDAGIVGAAALAAMRLGPA